MRKEVNSGKSDHPLQRSTFHVLIHSTFTYSGHTQSDQEEIDESTRLNCYHLS